MKKGLKDLIKKGLAVTMAAVFSLSVGGVTAFAATGTVTTYTNPKTVIYNMADILVDGATPTPTETLKTSGKECSFKNIPEGAPNKMSIDAKWTFSDTTLADGSDTINGLDFDKKIYMGSNGKTISIDLPENCTVDFYIAGSSGTSGATTNYTFDDTIVKSNIVSSSPDEATKITFNVKDAGTHKLKVAKNLNLFAIAVTPQPTVKLEEITASGSTTDEEGNEVETKVAVKGTISNTSVENIITAITVIRGTMRDKIKYVKANDDGTYSFTAEYTTAPISDTEVKAEITYGTGDNAATNSSEAVTITGVSQQEAE